MNSYLITGKDPDSDSGSWTLIIQATSREIARKKARTHIQKIGRKELLDVPGWEITKLPDSDLIVYSTVEASPFGDLNP